MFETAPESSRVGAMRSGMRDAADPTIAAPVDRPRPVVEGLPQEVLLGGVRRVGTVGFGLGGVLSVVLVLHHVARETGHDRLADALMGGVWGNLVAAILIALSFALMFLARRCARDAEASNGRSGLEPQFVLDLGLVFAVLASFGVAMLEHLVYWPVQEIIRGVSWICVWIVLFPTMIPATFGKTLLAVAASAAMGPLSYAVMVAAGNPPGDMVTVAGLYLPHVAAVILSMMVSRTFYRLRKNVEEVRRMGNYDLVDHLGEGAMGEVWLAEHRMLGRKAAVKIIRRRAEMGSREDQEELFARFQREAAATANLRSIHTVELYDFGTAPDGTLYYVMELLEGMNLRDLVENHGSLPAERAIYLLRQVCASLDEAHQAELYHRDVKPSNLFSCRLADECDLLKVLDFGLVGTPRRRQSDATPLTDAGVLNGSPAFIAPERILDPEHCDTRVDIYSLGCVAYWLVTGELVFAGDTMQVLMAHVNEEPARPSRRTDNPVPEDLEAVMVACLAKDPDHRPQTAWEVRELLNDCEAAGRWSPDDARRWWRDNVG